MKKFLVACMALFASLTTINAQSGCDTVSINYEGNVTISFYRHKHKILQGLFTINSRGTQIHFASGNLQYKASTNVWRFADNQYDCLLGGGGNAVSTNRDSQSAWIDLFGWGTSGWNSGATAYQPWEISTGELDYIPGGALKAGLTGSYAEADWAYHNLILNGGNENGPAAHQWRVLTSPEWGYLLAREEGDGLMYGCGTLMGVPGIYLLPDGWAWDAVDGGADFRANVWVPASKSFSNNVISNAELWNKFETAGLVFLPITGRRQDGVTMKGISGQYSAGFYWTSSSYGSAGKAAYAFEFSNNKVQSNSSYTRTQGNAVRPVQEVTF